MKVWPVATDNFKSRSPWRLKSLGCCRARVDAGVAGARAMCLYLTWFRNRMAPRCLILLRGGGNTGQTSLAGVIHIKLGVSSGLLSSLLVWCTRVPLAS